jgi:sugar/nucleoside kinase (ribokinase family)
MKNYHLYAIGNALVDSEFEVTDALLEQAGVAKRHMTLIDAARRAELLALAGNRHGKQTGGGSAGNTVVAFAQFGGSAFYSCRVADDELGRFYAADLAGHGVDSNVHSSALADPAHAVTGTCIVMITPDSERSMNTHLGATADLDASALSADALGRSEIYYMEGYLAASPTGQDAALQGRALARQHGAALALTLSDMSMIRFCRPGLEAMVGDGLDYLFCNEEEARVWLGLDDLDAVMAALAPLATVVCLTRGPKGSVIIDRGTPHAVAAPSIHAVDSNGAGDMFAGAFLYAVTHGHTLQRAAWLANHAAAAVVSQYGNRLDAPAIARLQSEFAAQWSGAR